MQCGINMLQVTVPCSIIIIMTNNILITDCYYMFSRNGLSVNTTVSTVYFAKNANSMYDFRSSEDDNPVSVVLRSNGSDIQINCTISKLEVMAENDWMEVDYEGYVLTVVNKKSYIQVYMNTI